MLIWAREFTASGVRFIIREAAAMERAKIKTAKRQQ